MNIKNSNDNDKLVSINDKQKRDYKTYSIKKNFFNAVAGIRYCFKTQRNIPYILLATVCVLLFSWFYSVSNIEFIFLLTAIFLVLTTEVVNTAIEKTVDLIKDEYHPLAGLAKDVSAGAVLIAVIYSVITGLIIFLPKFFNT